MGTTAGAQDDATDQDGGDEPPEGPSAPTRLVEVPSTAKPRPDSVAAAKPTTAAVPSPATATVAEPAAARAIAPDPRLVEVEPAFARGDWRAVCELLAPGGDGSGELAPALALIYAAARKELGGDDAAAANRLAIRAMSQLLGVTGDSDVAMILAKRVLRTHAATSARRPAPRARVSMLIVLLALVIGGGAGWIMGPGAAGARDAAAALNQLIDRLRGAE